MQLRNLNKSVKEVLQNDYVVPLYQRNYAWGDEEIFQLLQDIYENFNSNHKSNYFVGSLVVLKRKNGDYEVIDGQQRLTTISLIAKIIDKEGQKSSKLSYDSRPEVESFLNSFYQTGSVTETTSNHLISHFSKAVEFINSANLNTTSDSRVLLSSLDEETFEAFKSYFFSNVVLVLVEIPNDTDVAHYFEVMNNRGEQLEKHEILKASLLEQLKESKKASDDFSKVWDACSQMNTPIQRLFKKEDREKFFGNNYDGFNFEISDCGEEQSISKDYLSIADILSDKSLTDEGNSEQVEVEDKVESIIDFPNFLMQVLKLYFSSDQAEIPLNGDELLSVFKEQKAEIDSLKFIKYLLFYRTVFDRFIVKTLEDENSEDNYKWSLSKPEMYHYEAQDQDKLIFKNSFKNQERIIKCLSMLQVTFRTKKYKNWLNSVLSWFDDKNDLNISAEEYLSKLESLALTTFDKSKFSLELSKETSYAEGTKTPHYLFNFLDYLLWLNDSKKHDVFQFKYRNSVEHHLPQSFEKDENKDYLDHFGNLCLVSKGGNSRMNNEEPSGKAKRGGKFYNKALPPKQRSMYDLTNERNKWGVNEIKEHYIFITNIINKRTELLSQ